MTKTEKRSRDGFVGGIILVIIGLIALADQVVDLDSILNWGSFIVAAIGALFLISGIFTRDVGKIIPGGILSGIGLGIVLVAEPLEIFSGIDKGGIFMLSFALGWVSITILTAVFTKKTLLWPLIPAAILGLIGGSVLVGGMFMTILTSIGKLWPLALIALGASVLLQTVRGKGS